MSLRRLAFVGAMSLFLVTSAATAPEAHKHGTTTNEDKEITDIQTDEELRLYLNEVRQIIPPSDCSEWNQEDARVVAILNTGRIRSFGLVKNMTNPRGSVCAGFKERMT